MPPCPAVNCVLRSSLSDSVSWQDGAGNSVVSKDAPAGNREKPRLIDVSCLEPWLFYNEVHVKGRKALLYKTDKTYITPCSQERVTQMPPAAQNRVHNFEVRTLGQLWPDPWGQA